MSPARVRPVLVAAAAALLLAACHATPRPLPQPAPVSPRWQPVELALPAGATGRPVPRDAARCAGRWYVVGGLVDPAGETRPAAWSSPDGVTWAPIPVRAQTFYGRQHVLYAVACRDDGMAALGAKTGGVHGNPRTGTWVWRAGGPLREVPAAFESFGGPRAVSASRLAAGPGGWLVAGARADGAAVWSSPDAEGFVLREGVAELAGDGRGRTAAYDVAAVGPGWLVVGSLLPPGGTARTPLSWFSADGRVWRRVALPVPAGAAGAAERVVAADGGPMAVGPLGDRFAVWRGRDDCGSPSAGSAGTGQGWRRVGGFGSAGPGVSSVDALAASGGRLVAVTGDGAQRRLWMSGDGGESWLPVITPVPVPDGGDAALAVAVRDDGLLVVADDGKTSRAWWGALPAVDR
ncbi:MULTISPECIES: hypothetical protein [unclassified Micromonospora]|uniref:hypothetical protein n=1 Tax=unclassified Micromonospora TaxID=2617518 RepID=UPI001C211427|nr:MULTISPECIES: hypothetical protein [unclassified Micromonospora]MBU8856090.1 hypothetical protein [Micromonospora sp. WMMB482]MDM4781695.1 hypothetical protein [Micromonospora sp. b486]